MMPLTELFAPNLNSFWTEYEKYTSLTQQGPSTIREFKMVYENGDQCLGVHQYPFAYPGSISVKRIKQPRIEALLKEKSQKQLHFFDEVDEED